MAIYLQDLRLTFIWSECQPDILQAGDSFPFAFLSSPAAYKPSFKAALQASQQGVKGFVAPWDNTHNNLFWRNYFGFSLDKLSGNQAWEHLIPLMYQSGIKIHTPGSATPVSSKLFFYPFGQSLALTIRLRGNWPLDKAVDEALQARHSKQFTVEALVSDANMTIEAVAKYCLALGREMMFGPGQPCGQISPTPFSIVTIIQGDGADPGIDLLNDPEQGNIQKALQGLVSWQKNWQHAIQPDLSNDNIRLDIGAQISSTGDVLYAGKRGRAVWFPGHFTTPAGKTHTLSCYHNNLSIATLQTESLLNFLGTIGQQIEQGEKALENYARLRECAARAARILSELYGKQKRYHTHSVRLQIEQSPDKAIAQLAIEQLNKLKPNDHFQPLL